MGNDLKKRIMRRVYAIWFVKRIAPALFLQMPLLLLIALRETAREFWVAKIVENFSIAIHSGFSSTLNYVFSAIVSAPAVPMLIIIFSLGVFGYLAVKTTRNLKRFGLVKSY
jgi:hypothetical protein